jgi:hypothetical protein
LREAILVRDRIVAFRVTAAERQKLSEIAARRGWSVSALLRTLALSASDDPEAAEREEVQHASE